MDYAPSRPGFFDNSEDGVALKFAWDDVTRGQSTTNVFGSTQHEPKILGFDLFRVHLFLCTNLGHRYCVTVSLGFV